MPPMRAHDDLSDLSGADDLSDLAGRAPMAFGAYEGADRTERMLAWNPVNRPADDDLLPEKDLLDARVRDMVRNDAFIAGATTLHKDHIVGSVFRLNSKPQSKVLFGKEDRVWEAEFQEEVETVFGLLAESDRCWLDASGMNRFTDLVRMVVGQFSQHGEALALTDWMPDDGRPFQTAVLMVDPLRLDRRKPSPLDGPRVRGGVEQDRRGRPIAYHVLDRASGPTARMSTVSRRVMARKPSGRLQVFHIFEQLRADQSRGVAAMVTALSEMRMAQKFRRIELERAIVAATYSATIESALPTGDVYAMMGGDAANPLLRTLEDYLGAQQAFFSASNRLHLDGQKIPIMAPGTTLQLRSPGNAGPLGSDFEASLLRQIAASLGLSYEQLSRDFSKTNYSSAKASMGETLLHMQALKRRVADRFANYLYRLWFEEAVNFDCLETVRGRPSFYEGLNAEAYLACEWIGAGQGQMDELKETQAAALRLRTGLSTKEIEISRIHGRDWREVARQQARELENDKALGLPSVYETEPTDAENAATGEPREETAP